MNIYLKPKIFRALKLSTLCLILGVEAGFATESYSQKTTFTISVQDQSVKEVFDYIEQHSEFIIFYLDETIDVNRKVSVNLKDQRVESILEQLFKNTDVMYTINDRQILLSKRKEVTEVAPVVAVVQQKKNTVTGVVLDPTGMPVIGANIMVKGTTNGTITDMDGKFSLDVDKDATLVISYIGFASQEIKVGNQTKLSISLKEDSEALDELVVTALGISRSEKALGYATQKFDGEELQKVKGTNIATSLSGRISGLRVYNSTEFGVAPDIKLRGETPLILSVAISRSRLVANIADVTFVVVSGFVFTSSKSLQQTKRNIKKILINIFLFFIYLTFKIQLSNLHQHILLTEISSPLLQHPLNHQDQKI